MSLLSTDLEPNDLRAHGFSYRTARTLAAASSLVYQDRSFLQSNLSAFGLNLVDFVDESTTNTQLFIAEDESSVILSFRGTKAIRDWIQNLQFLQCSHPLGGSAHIGFHEALDSVWSSRVAPLLAHPDRAHKRLFVTGHSLGGALATLAAAQMEVEGTASQIYAVYTYGQPLVGDRRFASIFNTRFRNRFWRFRNHRDLVTRIPPRVLYRHVQDRIKFGRDGEIVDGPSSQFVIHENLESAAEAQDGDILTVEEFLALQKVLDASEELAHEGLFGSISGIDDHSLSDGYLPHLRYHANREFSIFDSSSSQESGVALENSLVQQTPSWLNEVDEARRFEKLDEALQIAATAQEQGERGSAEVASALFQELKLAPAPLAGSTQENPVFESLRGTLPSGHPLPVNSTDFHQLNPEYLSLFQSMVINSGKKSTVTWYLNRLKARRTRYEALESELGIPWYFIAILHCLECNSEFARHLHNGDPLSHRTFNVPAGRPIQWNPPSSWEDSARDALTMKGYHQESDWSLAKILYRFERYNGFGYRPRQIVSPYLWSFSTHYSRGKFISDGVFSPNAISNQVGTAVLLKALQEDGAISFSNEVLESHEAGPTPSATDLPSTLISVNSPPRNHAEPALPKAEMRSLENLGDPIPFDQQGPPPPEAAHERIVDENDLLPVSFLERGSQVQRSVARVVLTVPYGGHGPGTGFGSGFLVAPNLLLTNHHVIPGPDFLSNFRFEFNFQKDYQGYDLPAESYLPEVNGYIHGSPASALDYSLIRLAPGPRNSGNPLEPAGNQWGYISLQPFCFFRAKQHFNIVQHPKGRHKEVSVQDNELYGLYPDLIRYTGDTEPGSSGSPVFDNLWQLVALHHAGGDRDLQHNWLSNEGIRSDRIVADLRHQLADQPDILIELGLA